MVMRMLYPFVAVCALILIALLGSLIGLDPLFGILFPYLAFAIFLVGFIRKVVSWGKSPVPYSIPTTCGQGKSLDWIEHDKYDCPATTGQVVVRMVLEVLLFRSLFRNTRASIEDGPKLLYGSSKWLWIFSLSFHYCFLVLVLRHMRLFTNPLPFFLAPLEFFDGILQIGAPTLYITDVVFVLAITLLFLRRVLIPQVRYISLAADYFPLFLIMGIAITGILMRYFVRVDIVLIKQLTMGLATFSPSIIADLSPWFYAHLFLVCTLLAYFPYSKLMHLGGVFLSPTRNMSTASRMFRHINPWNNAENPAKHNPNFHTIKPHSYAGYEDEFREFMAGADLPLEKPLPIEEAPEEAPVEEGSTADKE